MAFEELIRRTKAHQREIGVATLHISMHGNENGIGLTSSEFVNWADFASQLKNFSRELGTIKIPQVNLEVVPITLNFSSCYGAHANKINDFVSKDDSLFLHVLGPNQPVACEDSLLPFPRSIIMRLVITFAPWKQTEE